ncbi:MAG: hypothetical protein A3B10_01850 [Candidatus Doudnabacteria bacterium RIFCSPLOWO2_01_FULL_44_21]|uniref:Uncharacterized protein n=1 Tax=Candidatus Doudnabacteria bacterium RIFCSPLOWO2_01_FULL_44_21 TaxID=1817841 RepID=A0A1F5Q2R0_9BACT|nr:MAG: hypothetical protein A3B95_01735 [Candidatus Doudnabacteria bacterium RIFCSPHIGHO2_02_FULL_43_13b]OGE96407.1 MAG: hypothetical protein A3B10_01850 [Candidatus Doudnabacteria bacterium RIFCSPLOWO2_01_FULL_44_21]
MANSIGQRLRATRKKQRVPKKTPTRRKVQHPTRRDAERLLQKAAEETQEIMKTELESERIPAEIWGLRFR